MHTFLFVAALLAILIGIIHSVLGEVLIFNKMRTRSIVPTQGKPVLKERHVRIIWVSWHLVTVFGFGFSAILFHLSNPAHELTPQPFIKHTIVLTMFVGALLVLWGTKAKHPGWVGLLIVAALVWFN